MTAKRGSRNFCNWWRFFCSNNNNFSNVFLRSRIFFPFKSYKAGTVVLVPDVQDIDGGVAHTMPEFQKSRLDGIKRPIRTKFTQHRKVWHKKNEELVYVHTFDEFAKVLPKNLYKRSFWVAKDEANSTSKSTKEIVFDLLVKVKDKKIGS